MPEFVRVKDKATGHKFSTRNPNSEKIDVLEDEPAVDRNGRPLAAETSKPKSSGAKKASAKDGGEPADKPNEEGSK